MLSCKPLTVFSLFTLLQNQELCVLQRFLPSLLYILSSPKTEPTINICYQEGAVVPNHVGIYPSCSVLRVSSLLLCV